MAWDGCVFHGSKAQEAEEPCSENIGSPGNFDRTLITENKGMSRIVLDSVDLYYEGVQMRERSVKSLIIRKMTGKHKLRKDTIHSLKNISLCIEQGERVGLIGHNGAGKTSFLKALAQIYPVQGHLNIQGNVRALFDLNLGFEPEATGRENIMYRGLLIGLSPKAIQAKTEEIIAFTNLGEFIEYPVKTYSAGMLVRLAFAISTATSGDILLLDEILGAGDAQFMHKAKARIASIIAESQILIFASHDMQSLQNFCQRGLVFERGHIIFDGDIKSAISYYEGSIQ